MHGVYACGGCGGIWTDHAATKALQAASDATIVPISSEAAARAAFVAEADRPGRTCPVCQAMLSQTTLAGVNLDYCTTHGTWYDRGEMAAICALTMAGKQAPGTMTAWSIVEACLVFLDLAD